MDGVKGDYGCAVVLQTAVSIETEGVKRLYKEWRALN